MHHSPTYSAPWVVVVHIEINLFQCQTRCGASIQSHRRDKMHHGTTRAMRNGGTSWTWVNSSSPPTNSYSCHQTFACYLHLRCLT